MGLLNFTAAHFPDIFHMNTDSSCVRKTKGNEPWMLQPRTTHSARLCTLTVWSKEKERESQSKLLKIALEYGENTFEKTCFVMGNLVLGR